MVDSKNIFAYMNALIECKKQEPLFLDSYFVIAHALFNIFAECGFPQTRVVHTKKIRLITGYQNNATYKKAIRALEHLGFVEIVDPSVERVKQARIELHVPDWVFSPYPTVPELDELVIKQQERPKTTKKQKDESKNSDKVTVKRKKTPKTDNIDDILPKNEVEESALRLMKWVKSDLKLVSSLPIQLSLNESVSIIENYEKSFIQDMLERMENYNGLKKNRSVYKTFQNWARRESLRDDKNTKKLVKM